MRIDLGQHPWHAEVPFDARFVNEGPEPIEFLSIRTSCNCLVLDADVYMTATVSPGEELVIPGMLHLGGRIGAQHAEVTVLVSTGATHVFAVEYTTYATYALSPSEFEFGPIDVDAAEPVGTNAVFTSETAQIAGTPAPDVDWLIAQIEHVSADRATVHLIVDPARLPYGKNYGRVRVTTTDPYRPESWLAVRAEGTGSLRPIPAVLYARAGEQRAMRVVRTDGGPVAIQEVQAGCDYVAVEALPGGVEMTIGHPPQPGSRCVVRVIDASGASCSLSVYVIE